MVDRLQLKSNSILYKKKCQLKTKLSVPSIVHTDTRMEGWKKEATQRERERKKRRDGFSQS